MKFREKLEIWLDNPNTPKDAWMRLTFPQIDKQAGVKSHNACMQLPKIIAKRIGKSEGEVRAMRKEFRRKHGLPYS